MNIHEKSSDTSMNLLRRSLSGVSVNFSAERLGSDAFREDYKVHYAYIVGSMYKGISSKNMIERLARQGILGFLGTGGITFEDVEKTLAALRSSLGRDYSYGVNLLHNEHDPAGEEQLVDLYIKYGLPVLEASAFMYVTKALVKFRAKGLVRSTDGSVIPKHRVIAKVSRPEVAYGFLRPAPTECIDALLAEGAITRSEAELVATIPVADDICIESDSGGHTDGGVALALLPTAIRMRDQIMHEASYAKKIRIGAAGGIGTPEAAAAAFMMGADFITTGSINQCTVEAGTSDQVKELLQNVNIPDMCYAPAGDLFEMGAKVQVVRKGLLFPARANRLYELYTRFNGIHQLDQATIKELEQRYFRKSIDEVYTDVRSYFSHEIIERAESNPKYKMALIFRWYMGLSTRLATDGDEERHVDYQIHCGPAMGSFNQWVKGTRIESWRNRHVDEIGSYLMEETAHFLYRRVEALGLIA